MMTRTSMVHREYDDDHTEYLIVAFVCDDQGLWTRHMTAAMLLWCNKGQCHLPPRCSMVLNSSLVHTDTASILLAPLQVSFARFNQTVTWSKMSIRCRFPAKNWHIAHRCIQCSRFQHDSQCLLWAKTGLSRTLSQSKMRTILLLKKNHWYLSGC